MFEEAQRIVEWLQTSINFLESIISRISKKLVGVGLAKSENSAPDLPDSDKTPIYVQLPQIILRQNFEHMSQTILNFHQKYNLANSSHAEPTQRNNLCHSRSTFGDSCNPDDYSPSGGLTTLNSPTWEHPSTSPVCVLVDVSQEENVDTPLRVLDEPYRLTLPLRLSNSIRSSNSDRSGSRSSHSGGVHFPYHLAYNDVRSNEYASSRPSSLTSYVSTFESQLVGIDWGETNPVEESSNFFLYHPVTFSQHPWS